MELGFERLGKEQSGELGKFFDDRKALGKRVIKSLTLKTVHLCQLVRLGNRRLSRSIIQDLAISYLMMIVC